MYASDSVSLARTSSDSFVSNRRSYSCVILARTLSNTLGPPAAADEDEAPTDELCARSVMDPRVCEPRALIARAAGRTGAVAKGLFPPELASRAVETVERSGRV